VGISTASVAGTCSVSSHRATRFKKITWLQHASFPFFADLAQRQATRFSETVLLLGDNKVGVVDG
jgi:hypothetical protein